MHTNKDIKRIARENLTGHYSIPMGAFVAAGMIIFAIELPFSMLQTAQASTLQTVTFYLAELLISLINVVLSAGVYVVHLNMARRKEYRLSQIFYGFKNHPDRFLITGFLMMLLSAVSMAPFIAGMAILVYSENPMQVLPLSIVLSIVGMILYIFVQLRFTLLYFIVIEHPEMGAIDAFKVSSGLMKGNMKRIFSIYLSLFGYYLLSVLTLGIGYLWVHPYQVQTITNFYLDAIGELPESTAQQTSGFSENSGTFNQYV